MEGIRIVRVLVDWGLGMRRWRKIHCSMGFGESCVWGGQALVDYLFNYHFCVMGSFCMLASLLRILDIFLL